MGELHNDIADVGLAEFYVDWYQYITFVTPFSTERLTFLVPKPKSYSLEDWSSLIKPLSLSAWTVLGCIFLAMLLEYWLYVRMIKSIKRRREDLTMSYFGMVVVGIFVNQSHGLEVSKLRSNHARVLTGTFLIGMLVMVNGYKGALISFLSVQKEEPPINTMAELSKAIDDKVIKLIVLTIKS